ncbi:hypothetical protein [Planctopirus hydrillae]|uniref:Uncharacterized protein n=1 Tax=Planctopirus hydrillae TaxID=1841610 RepID=A0A1C3EBK3_9PLAN|nr:hypothetical protein [Planctopirus hydrillae]ODA30580.1 hypothetical protein A6X21_05770 [Planctopirus hydrillae]
MPRSATMDAAKLDAIAKTEQRNRNRRVVGERRSKVEEKLASGERRAAAAPRRKVERRRMIDPTTCERDYSGDEVEFMKAMDDYKRKSGRMFPTWSEVLEVVRSLGYTKPAHREPMVGETVLASN